MRRQFLGRPWRIPSSSPHGNLDKVYRARVALEVGPRGTGFCFVLCFSHLCLYNTSLSCLFTAAVKLLCGSSFTSRTLGSLYIFKPLPYLSTFTLSTHEFPLGPSWLWKQAQSSFLSAALHRSGLTILLPTFAPDNSKHHLPSTYVLLRYLHFDHSASIRHILNSSLSVTATTASIMASSKILYRVLGLLSLLLLVSAAPTTSKDLSTRQTGYWFSTIPRQGKVAYGDSNFKIYRNVKDFGAKGDGSTDDTVAINNAIASGGRCGKGCDSTTITPALVYFPPGIYMVSSPLKQYYYTHMVGDAINPPTLKATAGFSGMAVIDADPYEDGGINWFTNQNNFFRQIRNFVIDLTGMPFSGGAGVHWQVAQATSLQNIVFNMRKDGGNANKQLGIFMDNGSGGFMVSLYDPVLVEPRTNSFLDGLDVHWWPIWCFPWFPAVYQPEHEVRWLPYCHLHELELALESARHGDQQLSGRNRHGQRWTARPDRRLRPAS